MLSDVVVDKVKAPIKRYSYDWASFHFCRGSIGRASVQLWDYGKMK